MEILHLILQHIQKEITRVSKFPDLSRRRKLLTLVDKANVLSRLWRETVQELAKTTLMLL
jgi:isocitrate/isopropylmalate dehydrogenase